MSRSGSGGPPPGLVECVLCGWSPARRWRRHAGWTIVRCRGCGLLITWPRPSAEALGAFYERGSYYDERAMGDVSAPAWTERAREILARVPGPVTSAIDFGAGEGHAVAALRRLGLQAEGLEPSAAARASALRRHGLSLRARPADLPTAAWDLVTFIHSLEHVPDPVATLRACAAWLRPGGAVFIEVPHARTPELWTRRGRDHVLHLPAHLFHFTPETLRAVVARAGLETVGVSLTNPAPLERLFTWRAQRRRGSCSTAAPAPAPHSGSGSGPGRRPVLRCLWAEHVLPGLRARFPGYKFQLVALWPGAAAHSPPTHVARSQ